MIYEWKLDGVTRNFGDALYEVMYSTEDLLRMSQNEERCYFLIGSVICNDLILEAVNLGLEPVFVACGWRGEPLDPDLVAISNFVGCRGPKTQDELARHGVLVQVTGDPAMSLPTKISKALPNGNIIMIPHIKDPLMYEYDLDYHGVDEIVSSTATDIQSIVDKVKKISGARFVLTGSLHAAIIAKAYGVPFAIMRSYIDCLPKWVDWALSVELEKLDFIDTVDLPLE